MPKTKTADVKGVADVASVMVARAVVVLGVAREQSSAVVQGGHHLAVMTDRLMISRLMTDKATDQTVNANTAQSDMSVARADVMSVLPSHTKSVLATEMTDALAKTETIAKISPNLLAMPVKTAVNLDNVIIPTKASVHGVMSNARTAERRQNLAVETCLLYTSDAADE